MSAPAGDSEASAAMQQGSANEAPAAGRSPIKAIVLLLVLAAAALLFFATSQDWFLVTLRADEQQFFVSGQQAATPLTAIAVAVLALTAALALAGPVMRVILAVLAIGIGISAGAVVAMVLADPVRAVGQAVSDHTGIGGSESIAALVVSTAATSAPWLAVAGALLALIAGLATVLGAGRWPQPERDKYRRASWSSDGEPVLDWDAVTRGDDPTGVDESDPTTDPR